MADFPQGPHGKNEEWQLQGVHGACEDRFVVGKKASSFWKRGKYCVPQWMQPGKFFVSLWSVGGVGQGLYGL